MFTSLSRAALVAASILSLASVTACGAPSPDSESEASVDEAATLAGGSTYARLTAIADGAYSFTRVNGGALSCPAALRGDTCTVEKLVLPSDCDWECTDGILSLRGVTILRGEIRSTYDAALRRKVSSFVAAAGFDTIDATTGKKQVYRITARPTTCAKGTCPASIVAKPLNVGSSKTIKSVDFAAAYDQNYVLSPERGTEQMARPEGLLVSGSIVSGVFKADRVWRQWTPAADCDVLGAAKAYYFTTPPADGEVNLVFKTTLEAESYVDSQQRTVKWLVQTDKNANAIEFTGGVNDLWAVKLSIDTKKCGVTLTGEH